MMGALEPARIIFIGEIHNHPKQHENQLRIIKGLKAQGRPLTLGLELFERSSRNLLNQWLKGGIEPEKFKEEILSGILNQETLDVYFPILEYAKEQNLPIIALNAPRSVTSKIARGGLENLTEEDRRLIAREIEVGPPAYRERTVSAFTMHHGSVNLDNFFEAQVTWDETMAETAADYLSSPAGQGRRLAVIAGNEHIYSGYGIPNRTKRRYDATMMLVIAPTVDDSGDLKKGDADFAWATAPAPVKKRLRLGVSMEKAPSGGLIVKSVAATSSAEEAGVKPGDKLLKLNGEDITSALDFHRAAVSGGIKADHILTVQRGKQVLNIPFTFR